MRRVLLAVLFGSCLCGASAFGQTPTPVPDPATKQLAWDHDGKNLSHFTLTVDGTALALPAPTQAAGPGGLLTFSIPFPALTPGTHTIIVSACLNTLCTPSDPFPVDVQVRPAKAVNLRIR